jgi:hypothetical protein
MLHRKKFEGQKLVTSSFEDVAADTLDFRIHEQHVTVVEEVCHNPPPPIVLITNRRL